jgi:hypothetical protein
MRLLPQTHKTCTLARRSILCCCCWFDHQKQQLQRHQCIHKTQNYFVNAAAVTAAAS